MSEAQVRVQVRRNGNAGRRRGWRGMSLTRAEWMRLGGFAGGVLFLHLLGWGLFLYFARTNPALAGLGSLAYTFGLRHAFDADHIAAIDNTTRKLLQDEKRSMGVGFFFSLGHSTVVLRARGRPRARDEDGQLEAPRLPGLRQHDRRLRLRDLPDRDRPAQPRSCCSTSSASSGR